MLIARLQNVIKHFGNGCANASESELKSMYVILRAVEKMCKEMSDAVGEELLTRPDVAKGPFTVPGVPGVGRIMERAGRTCVDVEGVRKVFGDNRTWRMVSISSTDLKKHTTEDEFTHLKNMGVVIPGKKKPSLTYQG